MKDTALTTKDEIRNADGVQKKMEVIENVRCYEENGVAYLNLEDVARGLGFTTTQSVNGTEYTNVRWQTVKQYLEDLKFLQEVAKDEFSPQVAKSMYIPENIFYRLAMKAKNDVAEKFQAKVADDIIPSIRRHGIYATDSVIDNILNNPDFGIELLTKLKEERAARVEAERKNAILTHVNKTYTMTELAKELNMKSAIELNKKLADRHIQYKVNDTWVLYSDYSNLGYEDIKQEVLDSGKVIYHRRITQLGREFILGLFNR